MKKLIIPIIILLVVGVAIGLWYILNQKTGLEPEQEVNINPIDYLVFEVKKENYSEFQTEKAYNKFNEAKVSIEAASEEGIAFESNELFYNWLNVTGAMHMIGDYEREAVVLKWFTEAYPGNSVSPSNLGNIYKSFIIDNEQSEKYYLIALEREKNLFDIYNAFFELYRYNFEDPKKAAGVLEMGLENMPDERNLIVNLIDYYVLLDKQDEAMEALDKWLVNHPEDYSLEARIKSKN
jgi:tetratricopeptide (TPR) repeat protein